MDKRGVLQCPEPINRGEHLPLAEKVTIRCRALYAFKTLMIATACYIQASLKGVRMKKVILLSLLLASTSLLSGCIMPWEPGGGGPFQGPGGGHHGP